MPTGLTVADARAALYAQVDPNDANTSLFVPYLNQCSERIINSGQWKNTYGQVDFQTSTGYITLPRRWESIVGVTRVNYPTGIYPRMIEFMTSGPGYFDDEAMNNDLKTIIDQGDCCTQIVQDDPGLPQFVISNAADAGKIVRVYGYDTNGDEVFDSSGNAGLSLTLANTTVTGEVSMTITQIVKPATIGSVTLNVVVSGTPVELSVYEPSETNPIYRRYKTGTLTARGDGKPWLRCLCKRRFVPVVAETDLVWPDNLGALKHALIAVKLENDGAYEEAAAEQRWQKCYQILNQGLKQNRGAIRPTMPFWYPQSAGSTPRTN